MPATNRIIDACHRPNQRLARWERATTRRDSRIKSPDATR